MMKYAQNYKLSGSITGEILGADLDFLAQIFIDGKQPQGTTDEKTTLKVVLPRTSGQSLCAC